MSLSDCVGYGRRSAAWFLLLLPLVAVAAVGLTFVGLSAYFHGYPQYQYAGWWPFFGFGWVFVPLFFIVVFFTLRWAFWGGWGGWWRRGWYGGGYYDPALETLRQRFARGEITADQFESMVRDLEER